MAAVMFNAGNVILKRCLPITFHIKFPDMTRLTSQLSIKIFLPCSWSQVTQ